MKEIHQTVPVEKNQKEKGKSNLNTVSNSFWLLLFFSLAE